MATFPPNAILHDPSTLKDITLDVPIDPVITFEAGEEGRPQLFNRSRYSRWRKRFSLRYLVHAGHYYMLYDSIVREHRNGALLADWTHPQGFAVASADAATPIEITTTWPHYFQSGDTVVVTGVNASADGERTVTVPASGSGGTTLTLDGTSGGAGASSGLIQLKLLQARLTWEPPSREKFGPTTDAHGLYEVVVHIEES